MTTESLECQNFISILRDMFSKFLQALSREYLKTESIWPHIQPKADCVAALKHPPLLKSHKENKSSGCYSIVNVKIDKLW